MSEILRDIIRRAIRTGTNASFGYLATAVENGVSRVYEAHISDKEERLRNREKEEKSEKQQASTPSPEKTGLNDLSYTISYQTVSILESALKNHDTKELKYAKKISLCPMCTDVIEKTQRSIEKEGEKGWDYLRDHINSLKINLEAWRISKEKNIANPTPEQQNEFVQEARKLVFEKQF